MATQTQLRRLGASFFAGLLALSALLLITSLTWAKPADIIAVNPGDSIQAAIDAATPGDTVLINVGTYTESLTLSKAVSLTGVSSTTVIIHALPNQRVLTVTGSIIDTSVVISGLTFMGGNAEGGATWESCPAGCGGGVLITETAQPVMQNLIVTRNSASAMGGGLYANGPLSLTGVTFFSNTAQYGGGGAYIRGATSIVNSSFEDNACVGTAWGCFGGGLKADQAIELRNSKFVSNTVVSGAVSGHGGGAYGNTRASVTNSQFENNRCLNELVSSFCWGGGLFVMETLVSIETSFVNNYAAGAGGGAGSADSVLVQSRFEANQCGSGCFGSGLFTGDVTATDTVFIDNSSSFHSGGMEATNATVIRGLFKGNHSLSTGGGLRAEHVVVTGTYFIDNVAGSGGGLYAHSGRIVNAVFAGNKDDGYAAAIRVGTGPLEIVHTTIGSPTLVNSVAIKASGGGTINITDTIIANHAVGIERIGGTVYEDYNLFYGNTTNLSGTINGGTHDVFGNPHFVDPANTDYHIAQPSAAINAGVDAGVYTDLDGNVRPIGGGFDIGAYEAINVITPITGLTAVNDSPTRLGNATMFVATVEAGDQVSYRWDFGDGSALGIYQTVAHTYQAAGIYTASVTASNSLSALTATTIVTVYVTPIAGLAAINSSPTVLGQPTALMATVSAGDFVSYTWNFGDNSATANSITTTHIYPAVGIYAASVTAQNSVSVMTATTRVTITDVPISGLTAVNDSPTTIGNATSLTATIGAGSNVTYTWDFGDGFALALGSVVTHTYPFSSTSHFTATVTAMNSSNAQSAATMIIVIPQRIYLPVVVR